MKEIQLLNLAIWRSVVTVGREISLESQKSILKLSSNPNPTDVYLEDTH